ncbi:MAG: peptidylprolyl isomerase [Cyclobacteriaceae bacterium]
MKSLFFLSFFILFTISILFSTASAQTSSDVKDSLRREKKALKQARKIRNKLLRGADFHQLAEKYSDDPGSAQHGGELGSVHFGQFVPEFEETIRSIEPGKVSEPVRTDFGYHLIELMALEGDQFTSRHILIKP